MNVNEGSTFKVVGEITDRIYDTKGNLLEERAGHNIVVTSILNLFTCLLKGETGFEGIQYWAIGSGLDSWDSEPEPVMPTVGDYKLEKELKNGRVALDASDITFLNEDYSTSASPTNILQIQHTFDEQTANGTWREFGIFGGNATMSENSGIMINHRIHSVLEKTDEMVVQRTMRFTLTLA